jgi:hypothetical protein
MSLWIRGLRRFTRRRCPGESKSTRGASCLVHWLSRIRVSKTVLSICSRPVLKRINSQMTQPPRPQVCPTRLLRARGSLLLMQRQRGRRGKRLRSMMRRMYRPRQPGHLRSLERTELRFKIVFQMLKWRTGMETTWGPWKWTTSPLMKRLGPRPYRRNEKGCSKSL